jgi:hypothetical protein
MSDVNHPLNIQEEELDLDEILDGSDIQNAELRDRAEGEIVEEILQGIDAEEKGKKVSDKVNKIISSYAQTSNLERSAEKLKKALLPEGLEFLQQTKVNECVYSLLSNKQKKENAELMKVESAMCKTMGCHAYIMEKIFNLREALPASHSHTVKDLIRDIADCTNFLAFGRRKLNGVRQQMAAAALNPEFRNLADNTTPSEGLLFGNNIADSVKEVESANKLTARLSTAASSHRSYGQASSDSRQHFLGRAQGPPPRRKEPPINCYHQNTRHNNNYRFQRTYGRKRSPRRQRSPSPKRQRVTR